MKIFEITWKEIKESWKTTIIFAILMALMFYWFISIFDPEALADLEAVYDAYPDELKEMIGGQIALAKFGGFMHIYLFSMAWFYFGFYFVMKAAIDIPKEIEDKTIDLMLSKPIKRWDFALGKYFSHIAAAIVIIICVYVAVIIGIYTFPNVNPEDVQFYELNIAFIWLLILMVSFVSTGFFFSTFLNTKRSVIMALGLIIFFYIIGMYWELFDESIEDIRFFSIFYYFDTSRVLIDEDMENVVRDMWILLGYSAAMVATGVIIFNKRDIPV